METDDTLAAIEARMIRSGRTIKELLAEADIDGSLWWRWRQGKAAPRRSSLKLIEQAADKLAPKGKRK